MAWSRPSQGKPLGTSRARGGAHRDRSRRQFPDRTQKCVAKNHCIGIGKVYICASFSRRWDGACSSSALQACGTAFSRNANKRAYTKVSRRTTSQWTAQTDGTNLTPSGQGARPAPQQDARLFRARPLVRVPPVLSKLNHRKVQHTRARRITTRLVPRAPFRSRVCSVLSFFLGGPSAAAAPWRYRSGGNLPST